jgi:4-hydroxy-3-methylbut-2-enyl diphosphate reductase
MSARALPTFHIVGAGCIDGDVIRHRPLAGGGEAPTPGWLAAGPVTIGVTSGASTPDSVVGEVVERILTLRGQRAADLTACGGRLASHA